MKNWKKILVAAVIGLLVVIGVSEFVMQQDYVQVHDFFEDPDYIENIEVGEPIAVNDVIETGNGYIINGEDAYFVYLTDIDECYAVEVTFADEVEVAGLVQIFYADEGLAFSEENSVYARFSPGIESVQAPIEMHDVRSIRIDVDVEEGTEIELAGLRQDTRAERITDIFWFSGFYLFGGIYLIVLVCYALNLKYDFMKNQKIRYWSIVFAVWAGVVIVAFMPVICGKYDLSYSNMMYTAVPWNYMDVATSGPDLSDAIDSALAGIYEAYYGSGYYEWNQYTAFGSAEMGVVTYLNPFYWFYFLPIKWAILLKTMFKISVAYFGMCYFLKKLKLEITAVVIGSASYALSSGMIMWLFWPHTDVMMLAPIALGLGMQLVVDKKFRTMFALAFITFLMLIATMPTFAACVMYLLGFYVLIMTIVQYRKKIKDIIAVYSMFAGSMVLAIVSAFPYLYTILSTVEENGYVDKRRDKATWTHSFACLRTTVLPYYREGIENHINESTLYVGIIILVLLVLTGFGWKRKKGKYWVFALGITMLFTYSHLLDSVYKYMPVINSSAKFRLIVLIALLACVVGAINLNDVIKNKEFYQENKWRWIAYFIVVAGVVYIYVTYAETEVWAVWSSIVMMVAIVVIEIILSVSNISVTAVCKSILVGITVLNMGIFANQYFPMIEKGADIIPEPTDTIEYLQDNIDDGRMYVISQNGWNFFPNVNMYYELPNIASHSFVNTNEDVANYLCAIDDEMMRTETAYQGIKIDNYNLLKYGGVKYIVKPVRYDEMIAEDATLVFSGDDGEEVYELDSYNGRLFLGAEVSVAKNQDQVLEEMMEEYKVNRVWIDEGAHEDIWENSPLEEGEGIVVLEDMTDYIKAEVTANEPRIVVQNEYNDGNWRAYVDGQEVDIIRVNYLFKGVMVEAGVHTVEFVYDTDTEKSLLAVALVAIGVILVGMAGTFAGEKIVNQRKNRSESK